MKVNRSHHERLIPNGVFVSHKHIDDMIERYCFVLGKYVKYKNKKEINRKSVIY